MFLYACAEHPSENVQLAERVKYAYPQEFLNLSVEYGVRPFFRRISEIRCLGSGIGRASDGHQESEVRLSMPMESRPYKMDGVEGKGEVRMVTNTSEGTRDSRKDTDCLPVNTETNKVKGPQGNGNSNSRNSIAERLNVMGWILFAIAGVFALALWATCIIGTIVGTVKNMVGWKLAFAGFEVGHLSSFLLVFLAFLFKTILDGFAELIQIAHDVRKDVQGK